MRGSSNIAIDNLNLVFVHAKLHLKIFAVMLKEVQAGLFINDMKERLVKEAVFILGVSLL